MRNQLQPENNVNEVFSLQEKDFFLRKIFIDKQPESAFLYKGNGADFFDKIVQSGKYTGNTDEMNLLEIQKYNILHFVGENITDIGCGNGNKAIILLEGQSNKKYTACDYSGSMIEIAENNIRENNPNITFGNHQVMRPGNSLFTSNLKNNTYLRLGGEMGCHTPESIIKNLKDMDNKGILSGNKILFSYYKAPKTEKELKYTKDMYDNKESKDFVFNGLINLGIKDTSGLKYCVDYNTTTNTVEVGVEFLRDYEIELSNGQKITKKKGEKSIIHRSKRFIDEEIKNILKESGLKTLKKFSENSTVLVVADRAPKYGKKVAKYVAFTASVLALALLAGVGGYQISQHNKKQKIKYENEKNAAESLKDKKLKEGFHYIFQEKKDLDAKLEFLEKTARNIYFYFSQIYDCSGIEDEVLALIQAELRRGDNLNEVNINLDNISQLSINFIKNTFIPNNFEPLNSLGLDLDPYKDLIKYKSSFEHTANLDGELTIEYNQFMRMGSPDPRILLDSASENINKMLPFEYAVNNYASRPDKVDTLGYYLTERGMNAELLGNYFSPSSGGKVSALKVTLQKDGKPFDVIVFSHDISEGGGFKNYRLNQDLAKEFLNTRAK